MAELKKCPFCGGEATLEKYHETCDGRGDRGARVKCKCGAELYLTFSEFNQAKDDFGYKGGYYSQNKRFWDGMHQRLVDKWNNRATESEIRAKAIDEFLAEVRNHATVAIGYNQLVEIAEQFKSGKSVIVKNIFDEIAESDWAEQLKERE